MTCNNHKKNAKNIKSSEWRFIYSSWIWKCRYRHLCALLTPGCGSPCLFLQPAGHIPATQGAIDTLTLTGPPTCHLFCYSQLPATGLIYQAAPALTCWGCEARSGCQQTVAMERCPDNPVASGQVKDFQVQLEVTLLQSDGWLLPKVKREGNRWIPAPLETGHANLLGKHLQLKQN